MTSISGRIQKKKRNVDIDEDDNVENQAFSSDIGTLNGSVKVAEVVTAVSSEQISQQSITQTYVKGRNNKNQLLGTNNKKIINNTMAYSKPLSTLSKLPYSSMISDSVVTTDKTVNSSKPAAISTSTSSRIAKISNNSGTNLTEEPSWVKSLKEEVTKNEVIVISYSFINILI